MLPYRKRGRVVEGSSLENCRRCEPFVRSASTISARNKKSPPGLFLLRAGSEVATCVATVRGDDGHGVLARHSPDRPLAVLGVHYVCYNVCLQEAWPSG